MPKFIIYYKGKCSGCNRSYTRLWVTRVSCYWCDGYAEVNTPVYNDFSSDNYDNN